MSNTPLPGGGEKSTPSNPDTIGQRNTIDSNNTTDNSRAYGYSNHNEINYNIGTVNVGNQDRISTVRDLENLEELAETDMAWKAFLGQPSAVDQDAYRRTINLDWTEPKYFWITKNIDFTKCVSAKSPQALHLCGPHHHGVKEVSSYIINIATKEAIHSNSTVLYFFSSSTPPAKKPITVFVHTMLHQIMCAAGAGKAQQVAVTFLRSLFSGRFQQHLLYFHDGDTLSVVLKEILQSGDGKLFVSALIEAIREAKVSVSSIIIDGIEEFGFFQHAAFLVQHLMMHASGQFKALLTSPRHWDLLDTTMPCIQYDKERQECLRSLQHDDTRYENVAEEHQGSLGWLWKHQRYLDWSTSVASSLLYIEGKPGSGKSTLAKYFEKHLREKESKARTSTVVHYFYTLRGEKLESTHENMLRSILHSILDQDESAFFHFQQKFREDSGKWRYKSLKHVLSSFATHPPEKPIYLILDAMDESEEEDRHDIVRLFCDLCCSKNAGNIKVFLASRPIAQLRDRIQHVIRLQDENKNDIRKFTNSFLSNVQLTDSILREATRYIIENAEGVFVWVRLVRSELLRVAGIGCNSRQIMDHLNSLPKELEEFYKIMLKRLDEGSPDEVQDGVTLLHFVRFATRPMTALELQHALATQPYNSAPSIPSHSEFTENLSGSIEARIAHCGANFLEINANNTVQLMHQTTREFFLRIEREKRDSKFALDSDEAHVTIATASVRYLVACFNKFAPQKTKNWDSEGFRVYAKYINEWPFVNYAILNLKSHYDLCGRQKKRVYHLIAKLANRLNEHQWSRFLADWLALDFGVKNPAWHFRRVMTKSTLLRPISSSVIAEDFCYKALEAAAAEKLLSVFKALLYPCTIYDSHRGETHLTLCVSKGLVKSTRFLLDLGDDVNAKGPTGRTALFKAAENGDTPIMQLLLERGARREDKDNHGISALHLALKKFPRDKNNRRIDINSYGRRTTDRTDDYSGSYVSVDDVGLRDAVSLPPIVYLLNFGPEDYAKYYTHD